MQKVNFEAAVAEILEGDSRYAADAYAFVRDVLDFTLKRRKKGKQSVDLVERHVGGEELLDGFREFAIQEFGPMATTVFSEWRITCGEDVGHIVFNLIGTGIFGKAENDSIDDFRGGYEFETAFVKPFLPVGSDSSDGSKGDGAVGAADEPPVRSREN